MRAHCFFFFEMRLLKYIEINGIIYKMFFKGSCTDVDRGAVRSPMIVPDLIVHFLDIFCYKILYMINREMDSC